jgi:CheY-like chemotaxis protein
MPKPRVMLVEDDPATLELLAAVLREEFSVSVARDGAHALEVANELGWDADAIVVDLSLGEADRGDQFISHYRQRARRRDIPVIVVSGDDRAYEIGRRMGARVLKKPVSNAVLLATVRQLAGGAPR